MKRINIKCPYCNSQAFLRPASAQFSTYASAVIRNHLLDCCKAANTQQKHRGQAGNGPVDLP